MPKNLTIHRSTVGTKSHAVRHAKGRVLDFEAYRRAHLGDLIRKHRAEAASEKGQQA